MELIAHPSTNVSGLRWVMWTNPLGHPNYISGGNDSLSLSHSYRCLLTFVQEKKKKRREERTESQIGSVATALPGTDPTAPTPLTAPGWCGPGSAPLPCSPLGLKWISWRMVSPSSPGWIAPLKPATSPSADAGAGCPPPALLPLDVGATESRIQDLALQTLRRLYSASHLGQEAPRFLSPWLPTSTT